MLTMVATTALTILSYTLRRISLRCSAKILSSAIFIRPGWPSHQHLDIRLQPPQLLQHLLLEFVVHHPRHKRQGIPQPHMRIYHFVFNSHVLLTMESPGAAPLSTLSTSPARNRRTGGGSSPAPAPVAAPQKPASQIAPPGSARCPAPSPCRSTALRSRRRAAGPAPHPGSRWSNPAASTVPPRSGPARSWTLLRRPALA